MVKLILVFKTISKINLHHKWSHILKYVIRMFTLQYIYHIISIARFRNPTIIFVVVFQGHSNDQYMFGKHHI